MIAATLRSAQALDAPRVTALVKAARLLMRAHVTDVTEYDNGRVVVASLRADDVIKGTADKGPLQVVEMRDLPIPPLFEAEHDVIAFLVPATRNSYLTQHLPAGEYMSAVKVKPGVLSAHSEAEAESMAGILRRLISASQQPQRDATERAIADRKLGFDLLAAPHQILVEDGITSITHIGTLAADLTGDEQRIIEAALSRSDLPAPVRVELIQTIGDRGLKQLVPALRAVQAPELADAAWHALSRLGSVPTHADIEQHLTSSDPVMRTAAVQQLLRQEKADAIPRAVQVARTDSDTNVRVAATEALGSTGTPEAIPALESIYTDPTWETRQAVGRALMQIGGRPAAEAFERMAFTAPVDAQRYAVVLLLLSVPHGDPLLQQIIDKHPDPELRDIAEHGIKMHEH